MEPDYAANIRAITADNEALRELGEEIAQAIEAAERRMARIETVQHDAERTKQAEPAPAPSPATVAKKATTKKARA